MPHALVIGGNGFIGSHLVDRLHCVGWTTTILDVRGRDFDPAPSTSRHVVGSLLDPESLSDAIAGAEVVYHLAWSLIHASSNSDPAADIKANLIPTLALLETCVTARVRRVVFISSGGTVYGSPPIDRIAESQLPAPQSSYGITKLAAEQYFRLFGLLRGLDSISLRVSVPYGPRQNPVGQQGAIPIFMYRISRGLPIEVWGDGNTVRDFFYISDLVDALLACACYSPVNHRLFNIGGGYGISLLDLVAHVEKVLGRAAVVIHKPSRHFDAQRIVLDTSLAERELGWRPRVTFDEGLRQTWDWIRQRFP